MWELPVLPRGRGVVVECLDVLIAGSPFIRALLDFSLPNVFTVLDHQPILLPDVVLADRCRFGLPEDKAIFLTA
jgi:hypothetical protein